MTIIILLVLSFTYIALMGFQLSRIQGAILLNVHNIMLFGFIGVYGILLPVCYILTSYGYNTGSMAETIMKYDVFDFAIYYFVALITSSFYLYVIRINKSYYKYEAIENKYQEKNIFGIALVMLLIGLVSDYLYLKAYGGYANYLKYSGAVRSGVITIRNTFSFLIVFRSCVAFSSFLFLSQMKNNGKNSIINTLFFLISVFFSLRVFYANKGRLGLAIYLLLVILYIITRDDKETRFLSTKTFRRFVFISIAFVFGLYLLGIVLSRNITDSIIVQLNKEISFVFVNFYVQLHNLTMNQFRWFSDVFLFPIYILPTSVWQNVLGITTASSDNTLLVSGFRKGTGGIYGEMPIDLMSLSYMQMGFVGLIVVPLAFSFLLIYVIRRVNKLRNNNVRRVLYLYTIIYIGLETIFYADPSHIIHRAFAFIVFLIIEPILSVIHLSKKRV